MKRKLIIGIAVVAMAAVAAVPSFKADRYRGRIHQALEAALGRRVDIKGEVKYSIWNGPGFSVADVVIHEDSSLGLEPFAYVASLDATVSLSALLLEGRWEVSSIVLDEPRVNLLKQDSGSWNVRRLLTAANPSTPSRFPAIRMRSGRINLKFGDTKSVLYFSNADLDIDVGSDSGLAVRFSMEPSRTDRLAQGIGTLRGRGTYRVNPGKPNDLDLDLELERSALSEIVTLLQGSGAGMRGFLASRAKVQGPLNALRIEGSARLEEIQRWDLLRATSGNWPVRYRGTLDFPGGELDLVTQSEGDTTPFRVRLRAHQLLDDPQWGAIAQFNQLPVNALRALLQYQSASLPERLSVDGKLSGVLGYSARYGLQGMVDLPDAAVKIGSAMAAMEGVRFSIDGDQFRLMPSKCHLPGGRTAELEATYSAAAQSFTWKTGDQPAPIADFLAGVKQFSPNTIVPMLDRIDKGTWQGSLHYQQMDDEAAEWNGQFVIKGARMELPGVSAPVDLASASVTLSGKRIVVDKIKGSAGEIDFTGTYRSERSAARPQRLSLHVDELDVAALERVFLPSLKRGGGFLGRLNLRTTPLPDWLRERHIDTSLEIGSLWFDETWLGSIKGRMLWDGAQIELTEAEWEKEDAVATGKVVLRLIKAEPEYRAEGEFQNVSWKGGSLDGEGKLLASGTGPLLLRSLRSSGRFSGKGVQLSPDTELRTVSGSFDFSAPRGTPLLKLSSIEASSGGDAFTGQGASESDGRLIVDLLGVRRKFRLTGTLWPFQIEPAQK